MVTQAKTLMTAFAALLTSVGAASAGDDKVLFRYFESETETEAGASAVYERMEIAARRACRTMALRAHDLPRVNACAADLLGEWIADSDDPALKAVHRSMGANASAG